MSTSPMIKIPTCKSNMPKHFWTSIYKKIYINIKKVFMFIICWERGVFKYF